MLVSASAVIGNKILRISGSQKYIIIGYYF